MFRPDVEGLRALAILSVIFFHFDVISISGGFVGVDIFFVISGYVISLSIINSMHQSNGQFSYLEFYSRRARRILPAFLATIIFVLTLGFLFSSTYAYENLNISALFSTLSLSNFYFMFTLCIKTYSYSQHRHIHQKHKWFCFIYINCFC